jgi:hypothetical protein
MSEDEYWKVRVTHIDHSEADGEHRYLGDLRLKLMEIADKVEAGIYDELSLNYFANNQMQQTITVGQLGTTQGEYGERGSYWEEVKVHIPEEVHFTDTYRAFMEDATIWLDAYSGDDPNTVEELIVFVGDNRSEGDTTKFIKTPQKS